MAMVMALALPAPLCAQGEKYISPEGLALISCVLIVWLVLVAQVGQQLKDSEKAELWNTLGFFTLGLGSIIGYIVEKEAGKKTEKLAERLSIFGKLGGFFKKKARDERVSVPQYDVALYHKDGTLAEAAAEVEGSALAAAKKNLAEAIRLGATDIHFEPRGTELHIRFRVDGIMHSVERYPAEFGLNLVSSLKVVADMDIAERRRAQDGDFSVEFEGRKVDVRASTAPSSYGEKLVLRLLDKSRGLKRLDALGMTKKMIEQVRRIVTLPHGMLVVSGPTGSGKTTTLYACLAELDATRINIITIENPVEYHLDNITQTPVNEKAGITFASVLRSALRQDPDVIMVGEVRDGETAQIALQSAMTGHFVFTTVHANDAVSTVARILDLGAEPFLVASSLTAVISQRLVRRLCPRCRVPADPPESLLKVVPIPREKIKYFKAKGCPYCLNTGYKGRLGLYELLELTTEMRDLIQQKGMPITDIRRVALQQGMVPLKTDGFYKVAFGLTTEEEVNRVAV